MSEVQLERDNLIVNQCSNGSGKGTRLEITGPGGVAVIRTLDDLSDLIRTLQSWREYRWPDR